MEIFSISNIVSVITLWVCSTMVDARTPGNYQGGSWQSAHATFYGGADASGTMGMLCQSAITDFGLC